MPILFLIFLLVPIIELALIIQVGSLIGVWWTILSILATAAIGVNLLRVQGMGVLLKAQSRLQTGQLPANELVQGFLLALAGAFLLTPGFLTDLVGFMLLIPMVRTQVAQRLLRTWLHSKTVNPNTYHQEDKSARQSYTIEGEYQREEP